MRQQKSTQDIYRVGEAHHPCVRYRDGDEQEGLESSPAHAMRFSVLRRDLRHGSPKALPEPLYVPGSVYVAE
jgi:hypothetical protein